jgi:copper(I)-binding protein
MQKFLQSKYFRATLVWLFAAGCAFSSMVNAASSENLVTIKDAWVRPMNPGQEVGAAYMTFLSAKDTTLISVESDVTKSVEIHNMSMENGVMKMRMMDTLPLIANKPYKLAPGGFHLMLFDLKKPLIIGDEVTFSMTFKSKNKSEFKQNIKVMVQSSAKDSAKGSAHSELHQH